MLSCRPDRKTPKARNCLVPTATRPRARLFIDMGVTPDKTVAILRGPRGGPRAGRGNV